jgi:thioredoxin-related protein
MAIRLLAAAALLAASLAAHAYSFLNGFEEAPTVAQAIARVKDKPDRHVLIYFGSPRGCPPCNYTRDMLNSSAHQTRWKPHYVVVNVDIYAPNAEERRLMNQYGIMWAPVLAFLDGAGKTVAYAKQLRNERELVLLNEFVSQKLYLKTDYPHYYSANFGAKGAERVVPVTKVAAEQKIDDRPRLRDVLGQTHERVSGEQLKALLPGRRFNKENQDWFLVLDLAPGGALRADGRRKDGKGTAKGPGKWYVTKKGKLCLEITASGMDENWCRHVFRAGETYYAVKDLRPDRLAYRFSLDKG